MVLIVGGPLGWDGHVWNDLCDAFGTWPSDKAVCQFDKHPAHTGQHAHIHACTHAPAGTNLHARTRTPAPPHAPRLEASLLK
eukprot:3254309-Amphidinium_carterae.1